MITKIVKVTSLLATEVGDGMEQRGLVVAQEIIPRKREITKIVAILRDLIKNKREVINMKWGMKFLSLIAVLSLILIGEALAQKRGPMQPPIDQAKLQELCKEIQPIYQREYQLRTEIRAQIWSATPNWDLVLEKELEAAKLRIEIMKKAHEKGLNLRPGYGSIVRYCGGTPGWR